MKKRIASLALAAAMSVSFSVPALAAGTDPIGFYANGVVEVEISGLTPGREFNMISVVDTTPEPDKALGLGSGTVDEAGVLSTTIPTGRIDASNLGSCYVYVYSNSNGSVVASGPLAMASYEITLSLDGGTLPEGTDNPISCALGDSVPLPTPSKEGFTFLGWYDGDAPVTSPYQPAADVTLTAKWEAEAASVAVTGVTLDRTALEMTVGGTAALAATVAPADATNKAVSWTSSAPGVASVSQDGTVTALSQGTATITVTTADGGFTASCDVTVAEAETPAAEYTITFDPNGGTLSGSGTATTVDGRLAALPTATRSGYSLLGWFTSASGGEAVTTSYVFTGNRTVYAHWSYNGGTSSGGGSSVSGGGGGSSSAVSHAVSVGQYDGGTLSVSPELAERGDTVTITAQPDAGYKLARLDITDSAGNKLRVERLSETQFTFQMPGVRVTVEASFTEVTTETDEEPTPTPSGSTFLDVPATAWYYDAVAYVAGRGLMDGTGENLFQPDIDMTRAMLVTILYRLENQPAVGSSDFTDVPAGQWYTAPAAWAAASGIVDGYGDGRFGPNDAVTREQMAAILYRYAQSKRYPVSAAGSLERYTDAGQVSGWAQDAMLWANVNGLITGNTATTINPLGYASRAEVATILMRFLENMGI
ncbi:S-layer homology domain-containing protein [uncultured Intestinimonas sp.]|uniref:S-layer homology domain-containing protein n=1 Tax=uncultured Intestinimonas sp. TaxID=1689265 RepID=UPI0025DFAA47|nr:S-layer homology domain-containing protein [uncultured Intestinimonas sp.]